MSASGGEATHKELKAAWRHTDKQGKSATDQASPCYHALVPCMAMDWARHFLASAHCAKRSCICTDVGLACLLASVVNKPYTCALLYTMICAACIADAGSLAQGRRDAHDGGQGR